MQSTRVFNHRAGELGKMPEQSIDGSAARTNLVKQFCAKCSIQCQNRFTGLSPGVGCSGLSSAGSRGSALTDHSSCGGSGGHLAGGGREDDLGRRGRGCRGGGSRAGRDGIGRNQHLHRQDGTLN